MLIYSPLQHPDWVSLTYHSFFWSAANFRKPKHCSCHCASSSHTPCLQSKGLFHFSFLPPSPNSLSQQPLLCRPHTWRAESRPIWQAQITTKKGKRRGKKKSFSGLEDSYIFLSGRSNQISFPFTMNQREWWWITGPCILTNQPTQK